MLPDLLPVVYYHPNWHLVAQRGGHSRQNSSRT